MTFEDGDLELRPFAVAEHIKTDDDVRWFLESAMADGSVADILAAIATVATARGAGTVAKAAGIAPAALEGVLKSEHPDMGLVIKILAGLGLRLTVAPLDQDDAA